jgi:hypothetical protein
MPKFATWMLLASVGLSAGCTATGRASDGKGYATLRPNSGTRTYISKNDPEFQNEVAAHNLQCRQDAGCVK